jgi:hypothetical protein
VVAFNYAVKMKELAHGVFRLRNLAPSNFSNVIFGDLRDRRLYPVKETQTLDCRQGLWPGVCNFMRNFLALTGL